MVKAYNQSYQQKVYLRFAEIQISKTEEPAPEVNSKNLASSFLLISEALETRSGQLENFFA